MIFRTKCVTSHVYLTDAMVVLPVRNACSWSGGPFLESTYDDPKAADSILMDGDSSCDDDGGERALRRKRDDNMDYVCYC